MDHLRSKTEATTTERGPALDAATFAPKFEVELARDPRSLIVSDDGSRAFVAHVVEARMSVVDLTTREHAVRLVDLRARSSADESPDSMRKGCQGFALAKVSDSGDAKVAMVDRIYAPMVSVDSGDVTTQSVPGGAAGGCFAASGAFAASHIVNCDELGAALRNTNVYVPSLGNSNGTPSDIS